MSSRFKLISILIGISLISIILIQVSWIRNSVSLRKEQFSENVMDALYDVSDEIHRRKDSLTNTSNPIITQMYSTVIPMDNIITVDDLNYMIKKNLEKNNIYTDKYEFCIKNKFGQSTIYSPNFSYEYLRDSYVQELSQDLFNTEELYLYINQSNTDILRSVGWLVVAAILFTLIILGTFYVTLGTLLNQRKLAELKSNFINNMTHEFKTPLATIQLAVDALGNPKVISDESKISYYKDIIKEENQRMNTHVEKILQTAKIDKNVLRLQLEPVDVHDMLEELISKYELQVNSIGGALNYYPEALDHILDADAFHLSNTLSNLIDNAIKYRNPEVPLEIVIRTRNLNGMKDIQVSVSDNGLGMTKEEVTQVFDRFYRADTGNIHNVKGFGLGLAYAKDIAELHGGIIRAESTPKVGSVFFIRLPLDD